MKLAWTLIVIGAFLVLEGTSRVAIGAFGGAYVLALGGVATGWLLGGFLLYKGLRRMSKAR